MTITVLEPGPVTQGPFPATVTQTAVTSATVDTTISFVGSGAADRAIETSSTSWVYISAETWLVSPPKATDLTPARAKGESLACADAKVCRAGGAVEGLNEDEACEAAGLRTGCLGQCEMRWDGNWWCYRMWQRESNDIGKRMGRACWGGDLRFRQLNVPCVDSDVGMGCVPCQGVDSTWAPVYWDGPG